MRRAFQSNRCTIGFMWEIFPELKGSECENSVSKNDERLRKTAIAFLKDFAKQGYENATECIDWLAKQGEKGIQEQQ